MKLVIVMLFTALTALAALPQTDDVKEFEGWMKTVQPTMGSIRKNIEAKNADEVSKEAAKLEEVFKKSSGFWEKRKTEDAVKWSQQAETAAKDIGAAAKGGDLEKATASFRALGATCAACHAAHREKLPEGGYKIK
jgi:cytochrome c556